MRDCPLETEHTRECGAAVGEDHEVVVSLAQLDLIVLLLRSFACYDAAQPKYASHTACENSRKEHALTQVPIPEHVHLELLLHYLRPHSRQFY